MQKINEFLLSIKDSFINMVLAIVAIVLVVIVCKLILSLISKLIKKTIDNASSLEESKSKDIITSMSVTRSVSRYLVYALGIIFLLNLFGYKTSVSNVLLTAGVGGLIISFGAQSFVKDLIAGMFILFEKQYAVGDYIKIAGQEGKVTAITMRSTYLDFRGQKIIIPNGQIDTVINFNDKYNAFRFSVPTSYEANTSAVIKQLQKILDKYYEDNKEIFAEKPEVLGVNEFNTSSVDVLVQGKCKTLKHFEAERELKQLIKEEFDKKKIEIPYQKIVVKKWKKY